MKRCLFKLALFLFLGVIVNVAVAWGIATNHGNNPRPVYLFHKVFQAAGFYKVRKELNNSDFPKDAYISIELKKQGEGLSVINMETRSYSEGEAWVKLREEKPDYYLVASKILGNGIEQRLVIYGEFDLSMDASVQSSISNRFTGHGGRVQTIVGWPIKSLFYKPSNSKHSSTNKRGKEEKVWHLPNAIGKLFPSTDELILPYGIMWPGFAINTFFYAVILWILLLIPFAARRMIRRKRGLCIKCGYDLRETSGGCPECGVGRKDKEKETAQLSA